MADRDKAEISLEIGDTFLGVRVPLTITVTLGPKRGLLLVKGEAAGASRLIEISADESEALGTLLIGMAKIARKPESG